MDMSGPTALLLAHTSDWFSTTLVCIPLVFFAWVLHTAKRRATARHRSDTPT